jgi:hypothetical protein
VQRYRLLRSWFVQTETWKAEDPFYDQKISTFRHSSKSIYRKIVSFFPLTAADRSIEIASTIHALGDRKESLKADPESLKVLFNEMIQMCRWCVHANLNIGIVSNLM